MSSVMACLTLDELRTRLALTRSQVRHALKRGGITPVRRVGTTDLYAASAVARVRRQRKEINQQRKA